MTAATAHSRKGWCPGALRPMASGDGLLVRVRARAGALTLGTLRALAEAADRCGNGHIDLTRRANLQLRGVRDETLEDLHAVLAGLGLLDDAAEAEAVRNIVVSPLAGLDRAAPADGRQLAAALDHRLATDRRLWRLPAKLGFAIDDGSALHLDNDRADIVLSACRNRAGAIWWGLAVDASDGRVLLGMVPDQVAADAAARLALAFIGLAGNGTIRRLREVHTSAYATFWQAISDIAVPRERLWLARPEPASCRTGEIARQRGAILAVGLSVPFGRLLAADISDLCDRLAAAGIGEVRLSPWRTLYVPVTEGMTQARAIREAGLAHGLVLDAADPILRVEACPGAPVCASAVMATRDLAWRIAREILDGGEGSITSVHVSGCSKGCAAPSPSDLVIVGRADGYGLARKADARAPPEAILSADTDPLPAIAAFVQTVTETGTGSRA